MEDAMIRLATTIKELAKGQSKQGICIGKVVSVLPVQIAIMNMLFTLEKENLTAVGEISLEKGDRVVLMPTENEQHYFLLGKVGEIHVSAN